MRVTYLFDPDKQRDIRTIWYRPQNIRVIGRDQEESTAFWWD